MLVPGFTVGPPFVDVSWEDIGKQLLTTLYAQVGLNVLVYLLGKWFHSSVASGFRLMVTPCARLVDELFTFIFTELAQWARATVKTRKSFLF
jgi:hypothetical protein